MNTKIVFYIPALLFILFCFSFAQQKATTDDGRRVILKSDSTWEYEKDVSTKIIPSASSDFRKVKWGMSKKQVKITESGKIERDNERMLAYSGKVSGIECLILYIFAENKLVRAKYVFTPEHTNKNDFIVDYKSVKDGLAKKYGEPKSDDTNWRNDLYKDDYSNWGFAISLGHLMYFAEWETESTEISLILSGENYKTRLAAEYSSKQFQHLEEKAIEKKTQEDY
jgi:hypothetical protein